MKKININNIEYNIIENYNDAIDIEEICKKLTDYFNDFDFIVGDWAYGKLRLKGFNNKSNKKYKEINAYSGAKDYLKKYCAYGCKYFILEKVEVET